MASRSSEKLLRVQGPRSSLGCQTCKSRHIKCDMQRPECHRCEKAQRKCIYTSDTPKSQHARHFIVYSVPKSPYELPDQDNSGRRALHHYRTRTALEIAYPFDCELWSTIVIQLSEKYDFVMSALIALSSMHELYFQPANLQVDLQVDGVRHYNKAIRAIVDLESGKSSIDAILVSCVAFCAIESLRGSWTRALQHALSGLQIIDERRQGTTGTSEIPSKILDEVFLALQIQVMEFGGQEDARIYKPSGGYDPHVPIRFASVDEALFHLNIIYNESACLLDDFRAERAVANRHIEDISVGLRQQLVLLKTRMDRWGLAMDGFRSPIDENSSTQQSHAVLILKAYYIAFVQGVNSFFGMIECSDFLDHASLFNADSQPVSSESFTSNYIAILDLLDTFFESYPKNSHPINRTHSMTLGVIPLLFMLATQDDPFLRERSLSILRGHGIREGPWDSQVATHLAERIKVRKKELRVLYGECTQISIISILFVDDTKCEVMYDVRVSEEGFCVGSWPASSSRQICTQVDVLDIHI